MNGIPTLIAADAPAGGAETGQVVAMVIGLSIAFGALALLGEAHRRGRRTPLGTLAAVAERVSGLPAWSAIPLGVVAVALPGALFGYMWDASWHIDKGRDPGPLANPAHYLILAGLYGVIAAAYLSLVLSKEDEKPGNGAIQLAPGMQMPLGGALLAIAGGFAFLGFPLDDIWHRLFGQDVTLWGPTHLMMLGGGFLTLIGVAVLFQDGAANPPKRRRSRSNGHKPKTTPIGRLADLVPNVPATPTRMLIAGGFLAGLSIFQGEYDFGVPQFELVLQPLQIAISAGIALVAARVWIGRGGALGAVGFYLLIRLIVSLLVGPVFGRTTPAFPLYVPEAICVEVIGLMLARRPLALGLTGGLAVGTLGFAAEWPWINTVFPIDWTGALMPEGLIIAAIGGVAAGGVGALLGLALRRELPEPRVARPIAIGALAVFVGCFAFGLADRTPKATADVTLTEAKPAPQREVNATVRFDPPQVADGANWVRGIAWQGGSLVGFQLDKIGEGVYRTPSPLPVYGNWKAGIRLQNGHSVIGTEIYAAADSAIPVAGIPAAAQFTRPMRPDREILQRERKRDVPSWLWLAASLTVFFLFLGLFWVMAWGLNRYSRGPAPPRADTASPPRAPAAVGVR